LRARIRLGALLEDMLSPDPDARPNPQEIIHELKEVLEELLQKQGTNTSEQQIQKNIGTLVQRTKDAELYPEEPDISIDEKPSVRASRVVAPPIEDETQKPTHPDPKQHPIADSDSGSWSSLSPDPHSPEPSSGEHIEEMKDSDFNWENLDNPNSHNNPTVITRKKE
ncbi:hypothetical protein COU76_02840, partial [Candidatus Peregrinibacteria bacterium CG10_big_fil_rev_8_21_14_0_10_49_10]